MIGALASLSGTILAQLFQGRRNRRDLAIVKVVRGWLHVRERRDQVSAVMTVGAAVVAWLVALVFVGPGGAVRHSLVAAVLVGVNAAGVFRAMWPASRVRRGIR